MKVAAAIAAKQPEAIALGKRLFWQQLGMDEAAAYAKASNCMAENIGLRETQRGIDGFLGKPSR